MTGSDASGSTDGRPHGQGQAVLVLGRNRQVHERATRARLGLGRRGAVPGCRPHTPPSRGGGAGGAEAASADGWLGVRHAEEGGDPAGQVRSGERTRGRGDGGRHVDTIELRESPLTAVSMGRSRRPGASFGCAGRVHQSERSSPRRRNSIVRTASSEQQGEVLGQQHVLVEDDLAAGELPPVPRPSEHVGALAHEQVRLVLDPVLVDDEPAARP